MVQCSGCTLRVLAPSYPVAMIEELLLLIYLRYSDPKLTRQDI
jgi:hypothetical protein